MHIDINNLKVININMLSGLRYLKERLNQSNLNNWEYNKQGESLDYTGKDINKQILIDELCVKFNMSKRQAHRVIFAYENLDTIGVFNEENNISIQQEKNILNKNNDITYEDNNEIYEEIETLDEYLERICENISGDKVSELKKLIKDLNIDNTKLSRKYQRYSDKQRIERKSWRENTRLNNVLIDLNKNIINLLKLKANNNKLNNPIPKFKNANTIDNNVGIIHITDSHFNELVDIVSNKYDFNIANRRIKKFIDKTKKYFLTVGNISEILLAFTGDLINSDRRLDELLSNTTNRTKAMFLAVELLEKIIQDLSITFNKITVISVTGNESRIPKDIGWSELVITDNYDFSIHNMLKYIFKQNKRVHFISDNNPLETVVNLSSIDKNILLLHGHQKNISNTGLEKSIQALIGKYSNTLGINIDLVLFGHLHSAYISDTFARGSSLVGANSYSDSGLGLTSRASQNIHILNNKGIDSIKIDLQNYDENNYYHIESFNDINLKKVSNIGYHNNDSEMITYNKKIII